MLCHSRCYIAHLCLRGSSHSVGGPHRLCEWAPSTVQKSHRLACLVPIDSNTPVFKSERVGCASNSCSSISHSRQCPSSRRGFGAFPAQRSWGVATATATAGVRATAGASQDATAALGFAARPAAASRRGSTASASAVANATGQLGAPSFCPSLLSGGLTPSGAPHVVIDSCSTLNGTPLTSASEASSWAQQKRQQEGDPVAALAAHGSSGLTASSTSADSTGSLRSNGVEERSRKSLETANSLAAANSAAAAVAAGGRRCCQLKKNEKQRHTAAQVTAPAAAGGVVVDPATKNERRGSAAAPKRRSTAASAAAVAAVPLAAASGTKSPRVQRAGAAGQAASPDATATASPSAIGKEAAAEDAAIPVVSECSSCSLTTATAWKKWLLLLSEADPKQRQQLLLQYPPLCKKHKKRDASGRGVSVVGFRQLLRLLEVAALHPYATPDAVAALRQRVRLGVTTEAAPAANATSGTAAAWKTAGVPIPSGAVAADVAARLAYVENGLSLLTLEKGAQLLQSLHDFDCTDSFLLEATAAGAAPRVGSAAPRWSFRTLEGPLNAPVNRQQNAWQQLESGSLLILKPVDEVSALLAKELRRLHGNFFDFSSVLAHACAPATPAAEIAAVPGSTDSEGGNQRPFQGEKKNRIRCVLCGRSLLLSAEGLTQRRLDCPACNAAATRHPVAATAMKAAGDDPLPLTSGRKQRDQWGTEGREAHLGDMRYVLQQLEAATAWTADRFALRAPAFIASICSRSKPPNLAVRVYPVPTAAAAAAGSGDSSTRSQPAAAATADAQETQQLQQQQVLLQSEREYALPAGARFWAMPVSFVAAVHTRQVEALASLADASLLSAKSATVLPSRTAQPQDETAAVSSFAPLRENHILRALTSNEGVQTRPRIADAANSSATGEGSEEAVSAAARTAPATGAAEAEGAKAEAVAGEAAAAADVSAATSQCLLTSRQREAVNAATSPESRIVTIEGPPGTGKTAVAAAVVREWLSRCTYTSTEPCRDPRCACRSPIFVAAGTHAALRSLKNKLDEEGVQTVRLSDMAAVSAVMEKAEASGQALVLLDTIYQGHRLEALGLRPRRILVDESSQLTEFAGLVALVHGADVAVLIGDEKQLPPASALPPAAASRSLFSALKGGACRSVLLNLQFRMPPLLAAFISAHFYEGRLLTHPSKAASAQPSPEAPPQQLQHLQLLHPKSDSSALSALMGRQEESSCPANSASNNSNAAGGCSGSVPLQGSEAFVIESQQRAEQRAETAEIARQSRSNEYCIFPWPDGSEGDRDLADRLMEQLQTECKPLGDMSSTSRWKRALHDGVPDILPVLFMDTSLWTSGPSRRLAKIVLPPPAHADLAAAAGNADVFSWPVGDGCSAPVRSLSAEQRVKGSLQNPLCVRALLRGGISRADIAILTPYQAQAQLLSRVLHPAEKAAEAQEQRKRSSRLSFVQPVLDVLDERCRPHPQVFTVDGFQGHERQYIILSAVKCSRRSPREFFLFDPRRINVALSRASKGLIIVGNAQALADASPTWRSFLLFLRALGAALPLDHPSLRKSLTDGLFLPRPATS